MKQELWRNGGLFWHLCCFFFFRLGGGMDFIVKCLGGWRMGRGDI